MAGKQQVWVLDVTTAAYDLARDELTKSDVRLVTFTSIEAMLVAAKSPQARLPHLLVVDAAFFDGLLTGPGQTAPRAALLRHAPFLLLTDGDRPDLHERAIKHGALEVIRKPFNPSELAATVNRCLVQAGTGPTPKLGFNVGALTVCSPGGTPAALTPREFQILELLYRANDHMATRGELFANVWTGVKVCNKVLDVHVSKLRKKLTGLGVGIHFIRPAAYRLEFQAGTDPTNVPVEVPAVAPDHAGGDPNVAALAYGASAS